MGIGIEVMLASAWLHCTPLSTYSIQGSKVVANGLEWPITIWAYFNPER